MKKIDLHIHTNCSDGKFSPKEIVDMAYEKGMEAIAITDHDTISGLKEAIEQGEKKRIKVVPGIELSCHEDFYGGTIDILGLFLDYNNPEILNFIEEARQERIDEKKKMIDKLNSLGYEITFEELIRESGESLGRPIIGRILSRKYPKRFNGVNDVFNKLIGEGKPAFVLRKKTTIQEAINAIKKAKGISILAHPGKYKDSMDQIVNKFIENGGDGIETDYPYQKVLGISDDINEELRKIAVDRELFISGGSDFHDFEKGSKIGDAGLTKEEFLTLKSKV